MGEGLSTFFFLFSLASSLSENIFSSLGSWIDFGFGWAFFFLFFLKKIENCVEPS